MDMADLQLELRLSEKTLFVNGTKIELDKSLFAGEISQVLNRKDQKAFELRYTSKGEDFACEEADRVHAFLEQGSLQERIEVYAYPEADFPTIALVGNFKARIYS